MTIVYLAGNIDFVSFDQASNWRTEATKRLEAKGFRVFNPMSKYKSAEDYNKLSSVEIFYDDISMIENSDILLVNFTDEGGFGTPFEIGYFFAFAGDVYGCVGDKYKNHPFVLESFDKLFDSTEAAIGFVEGIGQ